MKRWLGRSLILALFVFALTQSAYALPGEVVITAHTAKWDRTTGVSVTGYYLYYRTTGAAAWSNANRSVVITQPTLGTDPTFDLSTLIVNPGSYEICVTARDAAGNESGASNIVPFVVYAPVPIPANLKMQ
jgi:hypothetical protein